MDYVGVAEAAYRLDATLEEWLEGVLEASAPWLDVGLGRFGYLYRVRGDRLELGPVAAGGALAGRAGMVRQAAESAPVDVVRVMFEAGVVAGGVVETLEPHGLAEPFVELVSRTTGGATRDQVGVIASDGEGHRLVLAAGRPERAAVSPRAVARWTRVAAHIGAGCRLLRRLSGSTDPDGEAVLGPDGAVHHAEGEAVGAAARLRRAVLASERARGPLRRRDPEEALRLWRGLVDGRWSLVDRFESDGRRFVVAHRNGVRQPDPRGLTARELSVCERMGEGRSVKEIAYELGVSASAVANAAGRARRKLGVGSSAELVAFFAPGGLRAQIVSLSSDDPSLSGEAFAFAALPEVELAALSEAERAIALELLRGATTGAIAARRGSSVHTVENHIAKVYRKLGVSSRAALAAKLYARPRTRPA